MLKFTLSLEFARASISPSTNPLILAIGSNAPAHLCNSVGTPAATSRQWTASDGSTISFFEAFGNRLTLRNVNAAKTMPYLCTTTTALGTSVDVLDIRTAGIQS